MDLDRDADVMVTLHDLAGREVARPLDHEALPAGPTTREWRPASLAAGLYLLRASVEGAGLTRKIVWLGGR